MGAIFNSLVNLIKQARVSLSIEDTGQFPITQVEYYDDKVANVHVMTPYGFDHHLPVDSLVWMMNIEGQEDNKAGIGNAPQIRFKDLKVGEVAVGNYLTRSVVKFLENGDIEVTGVNDQNVTITGDVNVTIGGNNTVNITGNESVTVGGDSTLNVTGDATIDVDGNTTATIGGTLTAIVTGNTTFTTPTYTINGNLVVNGTISSSGDLTALTGGTPLSISGIRSAYNAHTHQEFDVGGQTGGASNAPI